MKARKFIRRSEKREIEKNKLYNGNNPFTINNGYLESNLFQTPILNQVQYSQSIYTWNWVYTTTGSTSSFSY
jgi:hypothetical protein